MRPHKSLVSLIFNIVIIVIFPKLILESIVAFFSESKSLTSYALNFIGLLFLISVFSLCIHFVLQHFFVTIELSNDFIVYKKYGKVELIDYQNVFGFNIVRSRSAMIVIDYDNRKQISIGGITSNSLEEMDKILTKKCIHAD